MTTEELKEQAREEFRKIGNGAVRFLATRNECYEFIDSLIDKTVQMTDERIVGMIEKLDYKIVATSGLGEYYAKEGVKNTKQAIISLITNKNDINK